MKMLDIIERDAVVCPLEASTRDQALRELLGSLVEAAAVPQADAGAILASMIDREKVGSTGFGKGIAVPHVKHAGLSRMVAAVGVSPSGVEFNALDRQPVYSIVMLLSPADEPESHLQAMHTIFKHLQAEQFRRFLRQAEDAAQVWTLLEDADGGHI